MKALHKIDTTLPTLKSGVNTSMNKKAILILYIFTILSSPILSKQNIHIDTKTNQNKPVHNLNTGYNYTTIQAAINAPETENNHTIFVEAGTYFEHVVINKSISLIGENPSTTIIDGNGTSTVILVTSNNVIVKEFTIKNGEYGIYINQSVNSLITENHINNNTNGIHILSSNNCTIKENKVFNNTQRGILLNNSSNTKIHDNQVFKNQMYGINLNASQNCLITDNTANNNFWDGIGLLASNNCVITGNTVANNLWFGMWLDSSNNNLIYHNNLLNNSFQADTTLSVTTWDNGFEGNYWSDYNGTDLNLDGIGDTPYTVISEQSEFDYYPLMGTFTRFNTSLALHLYIISNSTISNFHFNHTNRTILFNVTGTDETYGFCRICIPHALIEPPYIVTVNGAAPLFINSTLHENGTHRWIIFTYMHSTHKVIIVPEFASTLIFLLTVLAALTVTFVCRRKIKHS